MTKANNVELMLGRLHWVCIEDNVDYEKENALMQHLETQQTKLKEKIEKDGIDVTVEYFRNYLRTHILKK